MPTGLEDTNRRQFI